MFPSTGQRAKIYFEWVVPLVARSTCSVGTQHNTKPVQRKKKTRTNERERERESEWVAQASEHYEGEREIVARPGMETWGTRDEGGLVEKRKCAPASEWHTTEADACSVHPFLTDRKKKKKKLHTPHTHRQAYTHIIPSAFLDRCPLFPYWL